MKSESKNSYQKKTETEIRMIKKITLDSFHLFSLSGQNFLSLFFIESGRPGKKFINVKTKYDLAVDRPVVVYFSNS